MCDIELPTGHLHLFIHKIVIQFFIIYMPSQQPQGQLQTKHRVDTSNSNNNNIIEVTLITTTNSLDSNLLFFTTFSPVLGPILFLVQ
jgi:hypothetical protein